MRIPTLQGIIKRRILVNYRAAPEVIQKVLPDHFRPKLYEGNAIAGICLIRLENIRPKHVPGGFGLSSENAAHRIAVIWDEDGKEREGVYIPRRDTDSFINATVGGTLFPGEHHRANFEVADSDGKVDFSMLSQDKSVSVNLTGHSSERLPQSSIFSLADASKFFETGSLGYSVSSGGRHLDGIILRTQHWKVEALELSHVKSSYYSDRDIFSPGSIEFDHALIMRDIPHEWHSAPEFHLN